MGFLNTFRGKTLTLSVLFQGYGILIPLGKPVFSWIFGLKRDLVFQRKLIDTILLVFQDLEIFLRTLDGF